MARQEIPMVINLRQNKTPISFILSPANGNTPSGGSGSGGSGTNTGGDNGGGTNTGGNSGGGSSFTT